MNNMNPANLHPLIAETSGIQTLNVVKDVLIDASIDIVWESGRPLEPAPFPSYRSRDEWDFLLKSLRSTEEPKT